MDRSRRRTGHQGGADCLWRGDPRRADRRRQLRACARDEFVAGEHPLVRSRSQLQIVVATLLPGSIHLLLSGVNLGPLRNLAVSANRSSWRSRCARGADGAPKCALLRRLQQHGDNIESLLASPLRIRDQQHASCRDRDAVGGLSDATLPAHHDLERRRRRPLRLHG